MRSAGASPDPSDALQLVPLGQSRDILGQIVDGSGRPAVGVDPEAILTFDLQEIRHLLESFDKFRIDHELTLAAVSLTLPHRRPYYTPFEQEGVL